MKKIFNFILSAGYVFLFFCETSSFALEMNLTDSAAMLSILHTHGPRPSTTGNEQIFSLPNFRCHDETRPNVSRMTCDWLQADGTENLTVSGMETKSLRAILENYIPVSSWPMIEGGENKIFFFSHILFCSVAAGTCTVLPSNGPIVKKFRCDEKVATHLQQLGFPNQPNGVGTYEFNVDWIRFWWPSIASRPVTAEFYQGSKLDKIQMTWEKFTQLRNILPMRELGFFSSGGGFGHAYVEKMRVLDSTVKRSCEHYLSSH